MAQETRLNVWKPNATFPRPKNKKIQRLSWYNYAISKILDEQTKTEIKSKFLFRSIVLRETMALKKL